MKINVERISTIFSDAFIWCANHLKDLLYIVIILVLAILLLKGCKRARDLRILNNHNVTALTDSIKYYKDKNGNLVAQKTILYGDIETLKAANEKLAQEVKDMKIKKPDVVIKYETIVDGGTHDTTWQVVDTSFIEQFIEHFDFSNAYRELTGDVKYKDNNLSLTVDKDKVYADFTIAIENGKVFVKSDNPYISYDNMNGFIIPEKEPTWCLVVGPSISAGYDPFHQWYVGAGVSLTFGWNIKGVGKRIRR